MKCTIPEISWHNREPVLSVDINPISCETYRLATSGGDSHVLIWQMSLSENGAVKQELVTDLTRHQKAVNVVRWSPSGQYLASADDDANIIIWQLKTDNIPLLEGDTGDKEVWIVYKILRGHKEDIYDLCWSIDGTKLFSGSIDNTAILWDLTKGKMDHILLDHKGFVQGVAWDPKDQLVATISTDRVCRIFSTNGKNVKARIHKGRLPVPSDHYLYQKEVKYFHDDTFKSFFRRLQFSPDGSLLVVPSGHMELDDCKKTLNATLVFTFDNLNEPVAILPLPKQCSTAVRFCPVLFELHEDGPDPIVNLPYRMIFAVSTDHDVILYDTQQTVPFARFQEIHYTRLTDLTWSNDGRLLIASSTDGFCVLITFDAEELGVPFVKDESEGEENPMNISGCEELEKEDTEEVDKETEKIREKKRPSFIEQWAIKTPKRIKLDKEKNETAKKDVIEISEDEDDVKELPDEIREEINKLIPRRATSMAENKKIKDKSVARPIAVRRKPKTEEAAKEGAKPIEVRRKPRDLTTNNFKENKALNNHVTETKTEQTVETEAKKDDKKEPTVKDKAVVNGESEIMETKDEGGIKPSTNQEKGKAKKKNTKPEETTKIKLTSLTKKKATPQKSNPLLRFLKNPTEKGKKTTKKDPPSCVDLTLEEEAARDAWKCEKDIKESESRVESSSNVQPMEEDCTEEFCLQLEDTQESEKKNSKTEEEMCSKDEEKTEDVIGSVEKPVEVEKAVEVVQNASSLTSSSESSRGRDAVERKVPRRVQLITLSSPKGKKKQKP